MPGRLVSLNVGEPRIVDTGKRLVETAIWKHPVTGRRAVRGINIDGDRQADLTVHGGPDKAIYSYATEDYDWWSEQLGRALAPGEFGENLTLEGIDVSDAVIGERWNVGEIELEVCQPRLPCFKLGLRIGDPGFLRRFSLAERPGAYLRIISEGSIEAGDEVRVIQRPDHGVTVRLVARAIEHDHALLPAILAAPELAVQLRDFAAGRG